MLQVKCTQLICLIEAKIYIHLSMVCLSLLRVCVCVQVTRQMQTLSEELRECRTELQTQTAGLMRATRDREELAKDKAALDVKLNSADRNACGLTQELLALRSERVCVSVCVYLFMRSDLQNVSGSASDLKAIFPGLFSAQAAVKLFLSSPVQVRVGASRASVMVMVRLRV